MNKVLLFIAFFFWCLHSIAQSDSTHFFEEPRVLDGVYIPKPDSLENQCFSQQGFQTIWRKVQYKNWEQILEDKLDLESAYSCPEIAIELIGKELQYYDLNYNFTEDEKISIKERKAVILDQLLALDQNQNPKVRLKSHFLLGHPEIEYPQDSKLRKVQSLTAYIDLIEKYPQLMESGENFGPNLFDYRQTLHKLIVATAKYGDPKLGEKYIHLLQQTFANDEYSDDLFLEAAYYFALIKDIPSSENYLKKLSKKPSELRLSYSSGYFQIKLINWMNSHFDPTAIRDKYSEFSATIPDTIKNNQDENEIDEKRYGPVFINYQYYPDVDSMYRIVKLKDGKQEAIFEACHRPLSSILYEKGKLKKITLWTPFFSRFSIFKRFIIEYDGDEMVRKLFLYDGVYHYRIYYDKKNRAKYYIDKKQVKEKIAYPMIKQLFLEEGLEHYFKYNIPGAYEDLNGL